MKRLLPLLLVVLLTSCNNFHYDTELRNQVAEEGTTKTQAWFAKHLPQATDLTVDIEYYCLWNYITNITRGEFRIDSIHYEYLYNYETDTCLTSLRSGELRRLINERMEAYPPTDSTYYTTDIPQTRLYGETISNQDQTLWTTHYDEVRRETIFKEVPLYLFGITDEALEALADKAVANRQLEYNYTEVPGDSTSGVVLGKPGV